MGWDKVMRDEHCILKQEWRERGCTRCDARKRRVQRHRRVVARKVRASGVR